MSSLVPSKSLVARTIASTPVPAVPRVALVAASLDIVGGQGVQANALVELLRADGYPVTFIPINPVFPERLRRLRDIRYLRTVVNELLYLPSLRQLRDVDVVHIYSASYWSFLLTVMPAILAGRFYGKRVLVNYHSGEAQDHLARWGALVHPWLTLAHEIVVPSLYLQQIFAQYGYPSRLVRNVVDTARFVYRDRAPLGMRILSTRNLEPYYRVDIVLRAFALLKARFPQATLTVAGYGSEEQRLRQLAASLGTDGIRFVGRVEPKDMPELYENADIFVNASVVDNQPLSVLEAFAAGTPVVTTGTGDIANMVRSGQTGLIVAPQDPAAMAQAVTWLFENPERALRFARRARAQLERYRWRRVRDDWAAAYSSERN
jgi:glycosyltransferase involved in cell wall biosynthesis